MDGQAWSSTSYKSPWEESGPYVDGVKISELDLYVGQEFLYLFDFGDEWRFEVKLESKEEKGLRLLHPRIIEVKGKSPEQYPEYI